MLIAALTATDITVVVASVFLGLTGLVTAVLTQVNLNRRESTKELRDAEREKREEDRAIEQQRLEAEKQEREEQREAARIERERVIAENVAKVAVASDRTEKKQDAAAAETKESLTSISNDTQTSVKWSNHIYGAQLKLTAELSRWKADQTKGTEDGEVNEAAAENAERLYDEHMKQQAKMDAAAAAKSSDLVLTAQIDKKVDDQSHVLDDVGQMQKESVGLLKAIRKSTASVDEKTPELEEN